MRSHRILAVLSVLSVVAGWQAAACWYTRKRGTQPVVLRGPAEDLDSIRAVCVSPCPHGDECPCYGEGWSDAHATAAHKVWQSYALEMRAALFTATADVVQILEDAGRRFRPEQDVVEVVDGAGRPVATFPDMGSDGRWTGTP